jgi:hypothetical protein
MQLLELDASGIPKWRHPRSTWINLAGVFLGACVWSSSGELQIFGTLWCITWDRATDGIRGKVTVENGAFWPQQGRSRELGLVVSS